MLDDWCDQSQTQCLRSVDTGPAQAGDYVELRIVDTGTGMDEVTREKVFDPCFSTKGENGAGLCLSQIFDFVTRACGGVKVYSELGGGSEFVLYFPRYFDPAATTEVESVVAAMFLGGGKRFLSSMTKRLCENWQPSR
ncbi:MAG: ATP-binding protein [Candidatus Reddybacter sp.]